MAIQPTEVAQWCIDDQDSNGNPLKVAPPASVIQTGLLRNQPFARIWHNYYFNNFAEHIAFITEETLKVGTVLSFSDGNAPDFNNFVGTWTNIGSQVIGSVTVQYYERTA